MKINREALIVAALTVFAAALRFTSLRLDSLWLDELTTWSISSYSPFMKMFRYHMETDTAPPLYMILQHFFTLFLKQDEFGVRFFVALTGTLSVTSIYFLGKKFSVRTGVLAALLLAVSYNAIYFSQEARAYSLLILLCIWSSYFWLNIFFEKASARNLAAFILCAGALFYTHYYGLFFMVSQCVVALFFWKRIGIKKIAIVAGSITLICLPWIKILIRDTGPQDFWMSAPLMGAIFDYHKFLFDRSVVWGIVGSALILSVLFTKFLITKGSALAKLQSVQRELCILLFPLIAFAYTFWHSRNISPILYDRCMVIAIPAIMLTTAYGLDYLCGHIEDRKRNKVVFSIVGVLLVAVGIHNTIFRRGLLIERQKDHNREAIGSLIQLYNDHHLPVVIMGKNPKIIGYYFDLYHIDLPYIPINQTSHADLPSTLKKLVPSGDLIFFNFTIPFSEPDQQAALERDFRITDGFLNPRFDYLYVLHPK